MATGLLQIRDLHICFRVFGGTLDVVNLQSLVLERGEKVGLVGETGCGKTTTAKAVLGILPMPPAQIAGGEIGYLGSQVLRPGGRYVKGQKRRRGASMIFQDPTAALNPVFTIGTQLGDVVRHASKGSNARLTKEKARNAAAAALHAVAMPDPERILKNYPHQLSGGMRQRVCIALALKTSEDLLVADEPTTSLDVTIQDQILRLLDSIVEDRGMTVLLISHALGAVKDLTSRVYVMYAGAIAETAPTADFFAAPRHPYSRALLSVVPKMSGGGIPEPIPGRPPDYMHPPTGCRFHPRCSLAEQRCRETVPPPVQAGDGHTVFCFLCEER